MDDDYIMWVGNQEYFMFLQISELGEG